MVFSPGKSIFSGETSSVSLGTSSIEVPTGVSNQTIDAIDLQPGESLVVDRIEIHNQDFTGTSPNVSARLHDSTNSTTIANQKMGGVLNTNVGNTKGSTVELQVSNSSGSLKNLIVRVHAHIE